jgi:hypothetical protein
MRTGITIQILPADRVRLERLVADRNTAQKHARRPEIVLLTGDGVGTMEIMARTGQSKPTVWRWQARLGPRSGVRLLCSVPAMRGPPCNSLGTPSC